MLKTETVDYFLDNLNFKGYLCYDDAITAKRPTLLVAPTWMGLNSFIREKTEALAQLGYVSFCVDFFGDGRALQERTEAMKYTAPLIEDRQLLLKRMYAALNFIRTHPLVASDKLAAIGFCFGGGAALELAKSGADLKGVVSFHGILGNPYNRPMKPIKIADSIPASLLLLHGYKDTMVPEEDLLQFEREMSMRGVDWQVVTYGEAMHAFTNPKANMPELSLQYHEKSALRGWQAMKNFLEELFMGKNSEMP